MARFLAPTVGDTAEFGKMISKICDTYFGGSYTEFMEKTGIPAIRLSRYARGLVQYPMTSIELDKIRKLVEFTDISIVEFFSVSGYLDCEGIGKEYYGSNKIKSLAEKITSKHLDWMHSRTDDYKDMDIEETLKMDFSILEIVKTQKVSDIIQDITGLNHDYISDVVYQIKLGAEFLLNTKPEKTLNGFQIHNKYVYLQSELDYFINIVGDLLNYVNSNCSEDTDLISILQSGLDRLIKLKFELRNIILQYLKSKPDNISKTNLF